MVSLQKHVIIKMAASAMWRDMVRRVREDRP
jgi:hypothetical protein